MVTTANRRRQRGIRKSTAGLAELDAIDLDSVQSAASARTYVFAREKLQSIVNRRVCKNELWDISPTWTGWQYMFASTLAVQPVATDVEQQAALARLADIECYLLTEVSNLRRGQDLGYTAGQNNVDAVAKKVTSLINTATEDSPFYSPAARANDAQFAAAYAEVLQQRIIPAADDVQRFPGR